MRRNGDELDGDGESVEYEQADSAHGTTSTCHGHTVPCLTNCTQSTGRFTKEQKRPALLQPEALWPPCNIHRYGLTTLLRPRQKDLTPLLG